MRCRCKSKSDTAKTVSLPKAVGALPSICNVRCIFGKASLFCFRFALPRFFVCLFCQYKRGSQDPHTEKIYVKVYINSEPKATPSGKKATCFVGWSYKASTPEEEQEAKNGYVKQSAQLVAFGDQVELLVSFPKGEQVEINADYEGVRLWKNKDGDVIPQPTLVLRGLSGTPAASKAKATRAAQPLNSEEIPF